MNLNPPADMPDLGHDFDRKEIHQIFVGKMQYVHSRHTWPFKGNLSDAPEIFSSPIMSEHLHSPAALELYHCVPAAPFLKEWSQFVSQLSRWKA